MSQRLHAMLEEAADDSGRPALLDIEGIRAAGRRAVWRRRGIAGGLGAGVTAVVATVAVVVGTAGSPGDDVVPADGDASLQESAVALSGNAILDPLFDALAAAGYSADAAGTGMGTVWEAATDGPDRSAGRTASMFFPVTKDDAMGALAVAEFTDVVLLGAGSTGSAQPCAVPPGDGSAADFSWASCEKTAADDTEVWRGVGSSAGSDAFGVTVVRADGSGISVTMSESISGAETEQLGDDAPPPEGEMWPGPLAELPLDEDTFTELVMFVAADGGTVFDVGAGQDGWTDEYPNPCAGEVLAELSDIDGRTELVDVAGELAVCSYEPDSEFPAFVTLAGMPAAEPPLDPAQFGQGLLAFCGGRLCDEGKLTAFGTVPAGVSRITFEPVGGPLAEAAIVDGYYFARVSPSLGENSVRAPMIVRVYDEAGVLLLEGDATATD